jgi:hypothetical protein
MRPRHSTAATALMLGALVVLTGCGTRTAAAPTSAPAGSTPPVASPGASDGVQALVCAQHRDAAHGWDAAQVVPAPLPLPPDFVPTSVTTCHEEQRTTASEGTWSVLVEQRADSGINALVTAMRAPDEYRPNEMACTLDYRSTPWLAFQDASGAVVVARMPRTACDKPSDAAVAALDALTLRTVSQTRVAQVQTPAQVALDAQANALGCPTAFKDMIAIQDADAGGIALSPGGSPYATSPTHLALCRYTPDPSDPQVGQFASGAALSGATLTTLLDALTGTDPGRACTRQHSGFAALVGTSGDYVLVEVGGCGRVLGPDPAGHSGAVGQASAALLASVASP